VLILTLLGLFGDCGYFNYRRHDVYDPAKAREKMNKLCGGLEVSEMGLKGLQNICPRKFVKKLIA